MQPYEITGEEIEPYVAPESSLLEGRRTRGQQEQVNCILDPPGSARKRPRMSVISMMEKESDESEESSELSASPESESESSECDSKVDGEGKVPDRSPPVAGIAAAVGIRVTTPGGMKKRVVTPTKSTGVVITRVARESSPEPSTSPESTRMVDETANLEVSMAAAEVEGDMSWSDTRGVGAAALGNKARKKSDKLSEVNRRVKTDREGHSRDLVESSVESGSGEEQTSAEGGQEVHIDGSTRDGWNSEEMDTLECIGKWQSMDSAKMILQDSVL
jgi:hypothetical protein